ncbi:MAG: LysM peptidoglycan-binding domain-containing protein [Leptolinea sp.]|jgi:LysM repeat protein|nr:LysM peptidoglycan-binding domain-containing protein [Leptolinea sp.]
MKHTPTLLEGLLMALLVALLITAAIILVGFQFHGFPEKTVPGTPLPLAMNLEFSATPPVAIDQPTEIPSPTICPEPEGWLPYEMKIGDSLEELAGQRLIQLQDVMSANCLSRPGALPGTIIYLPPLPPTLTPTITSTPTITFTPTITLRPCDYPEDWVRYTLKPGDTLFKLGVRFKTSEVNLITGNCLAFGTALHAGDILLVPQIPTATALPRK